MKHNRQKGFTLPEALVAAAISAGVIAASATSLATSLKTTQRAYSAENLLLDAQNLASVLKSDMPLAQVKRDFPDWKLDTEELEFDNASRRSRYRVIEIKAAPHHNASFSFSVIRFDEAERR